MSKEQNAKDRYIAVDSGKNGTKIVQYNPDTDCISKFTFRTMMDEGDMRDDALERNTFLAEYENKVYKLGNAATKAATFETSKMSEIHKISTLAAIGLVANPGDRIHIAIGCPITEHSNVEKRFEYRDYILPSGDVNLKLKTNGSMPPVDKNFTILEESRYVYPETAGALYTDMKKYSDSVHGIIDIGGLNINGAQYDDFEPLHKYSFTNECGGHQLVSGLSQKLTTVFKKRCPEDYIRKVLMQPIEQRMLITNDGNKEIQEMSKQIISDYLLDYTKEIKRACDISNWALDYLPLTFIGGTTNILTNEIKTVFGENITIPDFPEYVNAIGFLRRLCAKELGIIIDITKTEKFSLSKNVA